ncbi:uncharacterized protein LOC125520374 isoform X6 [Triticum urartu]|uniref:uncharacterized protein LOC125520374 isoform X6 n=1 Tax=Triticum urartu TaxID=4572 RepID=UPI002043665A|nr:uncharacterized protein LOC125520374 isoform X6 [Triticum urartu]
MLHEEKAAAIKRLMKKGQLPTQLTEVDENGNRWPTTEALISAKKVDFGTDVGWRLLCEHWSGDEFRGLSLRNKRNRLANGDTVFHCSGARNAVATRQFLSAREDHLERENKHLKRENKRLRGIEIVVQIRKAEFIGDEVMCIKANLQREWEAGLEAVPVMEMMMRMTTMAAREMMTMARIVYMVMSHTMVVRDIMTMKMRNIMSMAMIMMIGHKNLVIFKSCQNQVMLDV